MSFPKLLAIIAAVLFGTVAIIALLKGSKSTPSKVSTPQSTPIEVELNRDVQVAPVPVKHVPATATAPSAQKPISVAELTPPTPIPAAAATKPVHPLESTDRSDANLPIANRIEEFFSIEGSKFPIVETITYKSRVAWQKGRPAWLSDYANHYQTSRHFIARSLNGEQDYLKQDLAEGDRFNVLRKDKNFQFYLVIDLSRCRLWFYYDDFDARERVLIKTYQVGIGRIDATKSSGFLTPVGKYSLGNKIAIYKPKMTGYYNGEQIEMMTVFGTRWIPFDKEIEGCSAPAKGFGLHGIPWTRSGKAELAQDRNSLGKYQSDGCIRLASEDIEEIFAIIITKPTIVELVRNFYDAAPPAFGIVNTNVGK